MEYFTDYLAYGGYTTPTYEHILICMWFLVMATSVTDVKNWAAAAAAGHCGHLLEFQAGLDSPGLDTGQSYWTGQSDEILTKEQLARPAHGSSATLIYGRPSALHG